MPWVGDENVPLTLQGDHGESARWAGFARNKLRQLIAIHGDQEFSQVYTPANGVKIRINQAGGQRRIWIESGGLWYEFLASYPIAKDGYYTAGLDSPDLVSLLVGGEGVLVRTGSGMRAKALFSHGAPANPAAKPPVVDPTDFSNHVLLFATESVWQNQRGGEYIWWGRESGYPMVVSASGSTGVFLSNAHAFSPLAAGLTRAPTITNTNFEEFGLGHPPTHAFEHDVAYDVRPRAYESIDPNRVNSKYKYIATEELPYIEGRFHRRTALQETPSGTFVISTDFLSRFYAYPYKDYPFSVNPDYVTATGGATDADYTAHDPPFPSWAARSTTLTHPCAIYVWEFNSTGTRAVTLPYQSFSIDPAWRLLTTPLHPDFFGNRLLQNSGYMIRSQMLGAPPSGYVLTSAQEHVSGLFEVDIEVTSGGENPPALSITSRQSDIGSRVYLSAGYAMDDSRLRAIGIFKDDLITLEATVYTTVAAQDGEVGHMWADWPAIFPSTLGYSDTQLLLDYIYRPLADELYWQNTPTNVLFPHNPPDPVYISFDIYANRVHKLNVFKNYYPELMVRWRRTTIGGNQYYTVGCVGFVSRYQFFGPVNWPSTYHNSNWLAAFDARSCSFTTMWDSVRFATDNNGAYRTTVMPNVGRRTVVFGQEVDRACQTREEIVAAGDFFGALSWGTDNPAPESPPAGLVPLSPSLLWLAGIIAKHHVSSNLYDTMSVHPSGAFAYCSKMKRSGYITDEHHGPCDLIIDARGNKSTHRKLYNKAFGKADHYTTGFSPDYPARTFRTFGIWFS